MLYLDMGNNKGLHKEGDGQGSESLEKGRVQPGGATKQLNGDETVDAQQDGAETPPVVWAVLRTIDRRLESMTTDFTNSMSQLSAQLNVKLSKTSMMRCFHWADGWNQQDKIIHWTGELLIVPASISAGFQHEEGGIRDWAVSRCRGRCAGRAADSGHTVGKAGALTATLWEKKNA